MDSAHSRPRFTRKPLLVLALLTSVMAVAFCASATSAFAWDVSNCITLNPPTATNQLPQQSTHTVTATVKTTYDPVGHPNNPADWDHPNQSIYWFKLQFYPDLGDTDEIPYPDLCSGPGADSLVPAAGVTVHFKIVSGPNAGLEGDGVTDANGQATFTWSSTTAGTDVVQAIDTTTGTLSPDYVWPNRSIAPRVISTNTCAQHYAAPQVESTSNVVQTPDGCPTAQKIWLPPTVNPPVTPSGVPSATLTVSKRCQTRKFKISSGSSNGTVTKVVLKIDGKTVKTVNHPSSNPHVFTVNSANYSAGRHSIKITTYFSNGSTVVKTGSFKRCAVRTSKRRVSPNFTG